MIHAPRHIAAQIENTYHNFMLADFPDGGYCGAWLLRHPDNLNMQLVGFGSRWDNVHAWGLDVFREEGEEDMVGFFGPEEEFLVWYDEMVNAGLLAADPADGDQVRAALARAREPDSFADIYEPEE